MNILTKDQAKYLVHISTNINSSEVALEVRATMADILSYLDEMDVLNERLTKAFEDDDVQNIITLNEKIKTLITTITSGYCGAIDLINNDLKGK